MRKLVYIVTLFFASSFAAAAAEMTADEIKAFVSGNTVYIQTAVTSSTGDAGPGAVYYHPAGTVLYKTPKGQVWHGSWALRGDKFCVEWSEAKEYPCAQFERHGRAVIMVSLESGLLRAKVLRTAPGNAEQLAP